MIHPHERDRGRHSNRASAGPPPTGHQPQEGTAGASWSLDTTTTGRPWGFGSDELTDHVVSDHPM